MEEEEDGEIRVLVPTRRASLCVLPLQSKSSSEDTEEFLELLQRVQASRLEDQRCSMRPLHQVKLKPEVQLRLEEVLAGPPPFPLLLLPPGEAWWQEREGQGGDRPDSGGGGGVSKPYRGRHSDESNSWVISSSYQVSLILPLKALPALITNKIVSGEDAAETGIG